MVEALHVMFLETTKITFVIANYIVINVDEVTTIDNTQWLLIHLYVVQKWKKILMFLYVETISQFAIFNNFFSLMLKCIINSWGLGLEELGKQLVNSCDSSSVFQSNQTSATMQFKEIVVHFHYVRNVIL
jgi:hypothetical protein